MTKEDLARVLCYCAERAGTVRFDIRFFDIDKLYGNSDVKSIIKIASGCAGVKLIKGRIRLKGKVLVSRGQELPYLKPVAVIEYAGHWPWDYCYLYRV